MNKKVSIKYNDEIDFIAFINSILKSKIKILIITSISFLFGLGYSYHLPSSFLSSLTIGKTDNSKLAKLVFLNQIVRKNELDQQIIESFDIQSRRTKDLNEIILARYIDELQDYDEFLLNIKNSKIFKENDSSLPIEKQKERIFNYARSLKIINPKKNEENFKLIFKWHDPEEAKNILQNTLDLTLKNLDKSIFDDLKQSLEFKKKELIYKDAARLDFLSEHNSIAKELNISDNKIDNVDLNQSNISLSISTTNIAYYLRGYKAIQKEMELIKNRDYQNFDLIEKEINSLREESIKWVQYNIYLLDVKSLKNTKLVLIASILLGLILGIFYVIISNSYQNLNFSKKKSN